MEARLMARFSDELARMTQPGDKYIEELLQPLDYFLQQNPPRDHNRAVKGLETIVNMPPIGFCLVHGYHNQPGNCNQCA